MERAWDLIMDYQKLYEVIQDWETEAAIANKDGRYEVGYAIEQFIKDLYKIIPQDELAKLQNRKPYIPRPRKYITGDVRF